MSRLDEIRMEQAKYYAFMIVSLLLAICCGIAALKSYSVNEKKTDQHCADSAILGDKYDCNFKILGDK